MSLLTRFLVFIPWLAFCEVQAAAQAPSNSPGTPTDRGTWWAYDKLVTVLDGTVKDLSVRAGGDLIYCTEEGELGTIPSEDDYKLYSARWEGFANAFNNSQISRFAAHADCDCVGIVAEIQCRLFSAPN